MAQTSLMPPIKTQFFDSNGNPAAGGKVYTWMAGTNNTAKASYTDSTGDTANTNPVTLDSAGMAAIWLSGYYHIQAYDSAGNLIADADNVSSMPNTVLTQSQWVSQNITLTYVDGDNFSTPGTLTTTFEVGLRVKATVSAGDIYGTISASTAGGTPVVTTVTVTWDSGTLDSGLSALWTGIITATSCALPGGAVGTDLAKLHAIAETASNINAAISAANAATATPTANTIPKYNASSIIKGAELNMTGETSATTDTVTTTLSLGTVAAGDRIFVSARITIITAAAQYGAGLEVKKTTGSTATIIFDHDKTTLDDHCGSDENGYALLHVTGIAKVTSGGTLTLQSSYTKGYSSLEDNQIYAAFLKKA